MSHQSELQGLVQRCAAVVNGEVALLKSWETDPGITNARAARCALSRRKVQDSGDDVADVARDVATLQDPQVIASPSQARRQTVAGAEGSLALRVPMHGPTLGDAAFDIALASAEANGALAASTARGAFNDCTGAASGSPGAGS